MDQLQPTPAETFTQVRPRAPRRQWSSIIREERWRPNSDTFMVGLTRLSAAGILLMLLALLWVLFEAALPSIQQYGWSFLFSREWRPNEVALRDASGKVAMEDGEVVMAPPSFGALPVIYGTAVSSMIALIVAVPLSLGAALFLVRVAPRLKIASPVSFLIEFLAAIPSIAYGIWGLFVMGPWLQKHFEPVLMSFLDKIGLDVMLYTSFTLGGEVFKRPLAASGRDMLAGGLILAIMIIPIITAVSRDVLKAVPRAQIEGTLALGATWWQSCREMLRYSRSGLFGAVVLGLARAAGETMAITMVIGNVNQISPSILAPAQTMSSLLANEFAEANTALHRSALVEVALILLIMSLLFNVVARYLVVGKGARTSAAH